MQLECDHSPRMLHLNMCSITLGMIFEYCRGEKTALLQSAGIWFWRSPRSYAEDERILAVVWRRPAPIDNVLRYVIYLYSEPDNSALPNNAQYTEHKDLEKWVMRILQSSKLTKGFEPLFDLVAVELGIMKPMTPTERVVEIDEPGDIVESRPCQIWWFLFL